MPGLARSVLLATWGTAALRGLLSPDAAADAVTHGGRPHVVEGLLGPATLPVLVHRLRAAGVEALRVALPAAGDPVGLPGPAAFTALAVDAGEAVLTVGGAPLGLVPHVEPAVVRWQAAAVSDEVIRDVPTLAEAERQLTETLREVTAALMDMDVARWRPEVADRLAALGRGGAGPSALAPGHPPRALRVLAQAQRLTDLAAIADEHPGAAVSASEMAARSAVLRPLARTARRAMAAAANAHLEPGSVRAP
jgi:hypothetical protein